MNFQHYSHSSKIEFVKKKNTYFFIKILLPNDHQKTLCVLQSSNLKNISTLLETNLIGKTQIPFLKNILQILNNQICQTNTIHCTSKSCNLLLEILNFFPTSRVTKIFSDALLSDHLTCTCNLTAL